MTPDQATDFCQGLAVFLLILTVGFWAWIMWLIFKKDKSLRDGGKKMMIIAIKVTVK